MKRFILLIGLALTFTSAVAIEEVAPYKFDANSMKFTLTGCTNLPKDYQSACKYSEKMMLKAKESFKTEKKIQYYEKILKKNPRYMPAVYELMFLYAKNFQAQEVYNYAKQLRTLNTTNLIPPDMITDIIARSCFQLNRFQEAANEFETIKDFNIASRNYLILAETYLKLVDYENAIKYASKIPPENHNYYNALEFLYISYYNLGDTQTAYKYAKELNRLKPLDAKNYLRLAYCCGNNNVQKLTYLYKAKEILLKQPDQELYKTDKLIAGIEQIKIDNAHKNITDFVVKPDWQKNFIENSPDMNFYIKNWSKPQDEFFKTANNCIAKYHGNNLVKCFEALNNSEEKRIQELKEELKEIKELQKQREQELMMQKMLLLQQQMNYNRYYYYPYRYLYSPYFYW